MIISLIIFSFVKHSMKESREGLIEGVASLKEDLTKNEKANEALQKQFESSQANLIDFLKSNNIPYQKR